MNYTVIIEKGPTSWGAYVPDLPVCCAAGDSEEEVKALIAEGIKQHLEILAEEGKPMPVPTMTATTVSV